MRKDTHSQSNIHIGQRLDPKNAAQVENDSGRRRAEWGPPNSPSPNVNLLIGSLQSQQGLG